MLIRLLAHPLPHSLLPPHRIHLLLSRDGVHLIPHPPVQEIEIIPRVVVRARPLGRLGAVDDAQDLEHAAGDGGAPRKGEDVIWDAVVPEDSRARSPVGRGGAGEPRAGRVAWSDADVLDVEAR